MRRALAVLVLCGCAGQAPAPQPKNEGEPFSLAEQTVGKPADGLTLRSIRHAPHPGFYRVVFDLGLAEGRPARAVPHATAVYRSQDRSIELTIAGVRHDLTGNRPLLSESGAPLGKAVPIERPPVASFGRLLVLDDSAVAYRIQLTREARFRLMGLSDPARIVVDVEDTGGAKPR